MIDTKDRILDAAERLFADQGYGATSLRHVIAEAQVNLAAVHYHFGTKEELLDHVIARRMGPVNANRLAMMDRLEAEYGDQPPPLDRVLEAFLMPAGELAAHHPDSVRLMGRMHFEGLMQRIRERHFKEIGERFFGAMRKAVPALPDEDFYWRLHFMIGAMGIAMCGPPTFHTPATDDWPSRVERLVAFLVGGINAPVRASQNVEVGK
jgi:AcrR family transcriptional regulator